MRPHRESFGLRGGDWIFSGEPGEQEELAPLAVTEQVVA